MARYVAMTNTGIYPYGIVRKGDVLKQKHLDALGEEQLAELIEMQTKGNQSASA